jgi:hypothetical protein
VIPTARETLRAGDVLAVAGDRGRRSGCARRGWRTAARGADVERSECRSVRVLALGGRARDGLDGAPPRGTRPPGAPRDARATSRSSALSSGASRRRCRSAEWTLGSRIGSARIAGVGPLGRSCAARSAVGLKAMLGGTRPDATPPPGTGPRSDLRRCSSSCRRDQHRRRSRWRHPADDERALCGSRSRRSA